MPDVENLLAEPQSEPLARRHPLTAARKRAFLEALRRIGNVLQAASTATPWASGAHCGAQTFRDERHRDPAFAARWDRALESVLGPVEAEIMRRAMEAPRRPVWERCELKGWVEDRHSSDKLLPQLSGSRPTGALGRGGCSDSSAFTCAATSRARFVGFG
jgi:hypothetical protein